MVLSNSIEPVHLVGKRIILRPLCEDDYSQYYEVRNRCDSWLSIWEPTVDGLPMDTTSTSEHFNQRVSAFERGSLFDSSYGFGIFFHDGTLIGEVTVGTIVRGPFQSALLGYWVDEKYAGRGFAPEAVSLVLDYGLSSLGFKRIEVAIVPRNKSSIRVVEKLGFEFEGVSKEYIEVAGVREDHARYSISPKKWHEFRSGNV